MSLATGFSSTADVSEPGALQRLGRAAMAGDLEDCCQLSRCFARGWGVAGDKEQAFAWFVRAARDGHDEAAFFLSLACCCAALLGQICDGRS